MAIPIKKMTKNLGLLFSKDLITLRVEDEVTFLFYIILFYFTIQSHSPKAFIAFVYLKGAFEKISILIYKN